MEAAVTDNSKITVRVSVHNSGHRAGQEVVQLYISQEECRLQRPEKNCGRLPVPAELGSSKRNLFQLDPRDFAYYNPAIGEWVVDGRAYYIMVGAQPGYTPEAGCRNTGDKEALFLHPIHADQGVAATSLFCLKP